jgi:hypothetical protein
MNPSAEYYLALVPGPTTFISILHAEYYNTEFLNSGPIALIAILHIAGYYRAGCPLDSGPGGHTNNSNIHCQQEAQKT